MSKKVPNKLSGRAVADEKGNQRWVWDSEGGNVDTAVVRSLGEELTLEGPPAGSVPPETLDQGYLRVLPQVHGSDGAFAARLRRSQ